MRGPGPARGAARALLLGPPALFLAVFFFLPLATVLVRGFELGTVARVVSDDRLRRVLWFTTWQAAVSTLATVAVALPCAFVVARYEFPGRRLLWAAVVVPFVLPTVVVGAAFRIVLGPGGPLAGLGLDQHVAAIVMAHVFFNYAVVVRTVGAVWSRLPRPTEEAAAALGAGPWRVWRLVTLPALSPAIAAAAVIVFLFSFTSFGIVLLLGRPGTATLEVEIYRRTALFLDLRTASALALVQLLATGALLVTYLGLDGRRRAVPFGIAAATRRRPHGSAVALVVVVVVATAVFLGGPLVVLAIRSVSVGPEWGLAWYRSLLRGGGTSTRDIDLVATILRSLWFGVLATIIAIALGGCVTAAIAPARRARLLDLGVMLPLGTSAVTLGFGFLLALDRPPFDLRASWALVPIAQGLVATPFVVRVLLPSVRGRDLRLREAAAVLGASPSRARRHIDLPLLAAPIAVAAAFAFAISLGEFGATVFVARPESVTIPIAIFRALSRPGPANVGTAMALSTILMGITLFVVLTSDIRRRSTIAGF